MRLPKSPPTFILIFAAALSLTVISGGTAVHLSNQETLSDQQKRIQDSAIAIWTMGNTTIIGLLSGHFTDDGEKHGEDH